VVHPASHQISRVRRYSRNRGTRPVLPSPTGLSPAAAARSSGVRLTGRLGRRVSRPLPAIRSSPPPAAPTGSYAGAVWAPPRSLAATEGIVSVPAGTEMFQFPACPPRCRGARGCPGRVAPFGDLGLTGCQRLPRAFRRVAASFLGRRRQGIHRALIFADLHPSSSLPAPATNRRDARIVHSKGRPPLVDRHACRGGGGIHTPPHPGSGRDDQIRPSLVKVLSFKLASSKLLGCQESGRGVGCGSRLTPCPPYRLTPLPRWSRGDSNPGPPPCKGGALPAKLRPPTEFSVLSSQD
jgi:hypothetical protein